MPGIYDDFDGFKTPSTAELADVLRAGIVVIDANVLLSLYRFNTTAADELLDVLEALGDAVWVPHQALEEFWNNRQSLLKDPKAVIATTQALNKSLESASQAVRTWSNRLGIQPDERQSIISALNAATAEAVEKVQRLSDALDMPSFIRDTSTDPVLTRLEAILDGRVGCPPTSEQRTTWTAEAARRLAAQIPPGYKDSNKTDGRQAGDFFVWAQTLERARERQVDVVLVTGDTKEDWWRIEAGDLQGPRIELCRELRMVAGTRLFMLRPAQLLDLAGPLLEVAISEESLDNIDQVEDYDIEVYLYDEVDEWSDAAIAALLRRLSVEAPVQFRCIAAASANGGFVSREEVYDIGDYDAERRLRGFTRPVKRITGSLIDSFMLGSGAPPMLVTEYDTYGLATGFRIPETVLPLVTSFFGRPGSQATEG